MFKSSLRFSSWVILASFLSVSLSHAMDKEEENKALPYQMVQYIADFVTDPKDLESMTFVNKVWNRAMKKRSKNVHESIQEKMKNFGEDDKKLIRNIFDKELDCNKHTHFNVLKIMNCFSENPEKYKMLSQEFLKFPYLSKFHKRIMMLNATEFGLLKCTSKLIQKYELFSFEQMGVLEKYAELLIPKLSYDLSNDYYLLLL